MYLPFFVARLAVRRDPRYVVRGTAKRWNLTTGTAHEQSEYIMAVLPREDALSPSNELARYRRRSSGAAALRSSVIFESVRGIERMCAFDNSTGNTELSG